MWLNFPNSPLTYLLWETHSLNYDSCVTKNLSRDLWVLVFSLATLRNSTTPFLLPPSVLAGSDHVSTSTLSSSVFSSPTFWLMSLKYLPAPPPFFFVPLLSFLQFYFPPTNPHLSFAFFSHLHTQPPTHRKLPPGLIISLQLLRGDLEQIRRENQAVFNRALALTRKLGFPDVILPGEKANT